MKAGCCSLVIFLLCLLKVVSIRAACSDPVAPENIVLVNSNGETATFKCSIGYQPVSARASTSITCSANQWTQLELQCKKKKCPSLPEIHNGGYTFSPVGEEGMLFGATATAWCNKGYLLVGKASRNCLDAGWDGREPTCEAIKCPAPSTIVNGNTEGNTEEDYTYGQVVSYFCDQGFTLFGESALACSDNGTFQPSPPRCIKVSCKPPTYANGYRIEGRPPYGYKSIIRFKCDPGYVLTGADYLVCEENEWKPPPSNCTPVLCEELNIEHGHITGQRPPFIYKVIVKVNCDPGYELRGSGELHCGENGWNPPPPACNKVIQPTTRTTKATTTTTTTTTEGKKPPSPDDDRSNGNLGLKVGLPIALGLVGALVGVVYFVFRKKKHSTGYSGNVATKSEEGPL